MEHFNDEGGLRENSQTDWSWRKGYSNPGSHSVRLVSRKTSPGGERNGCNEFYWSTRMAALESGTKSTAFVDLTCLVWTVRAGGGAGNVSSVHFGSLIPINHGLNTCLNVLLSTCSPTRLRLTYVLMAGSSMMMHHITKLSSEFDSKLPSRWSGVQQMAFGM